MGPLMSVKSDEIEEDNTNIFPVGDADFSVLDDLLVDILVHIPPADLLNNCRAVCKAWKALIDGHGLWKSKCKREKRFIPSIKFREELPDHYYRKIYFYDPYRRNLIINPCGEDGLDAWEVTANGGDGFAIENPPAGADPVPSEVGSQSCFSTTFLPCEKHQVIDLYREGIPRDVLQLKATKIEISEWYAARFDCASEYILSVILLSEDYNVYNSNSYDLSKKDEFNFSFQEEQWAGREWHKVTHEFENVSEVRYVFFQHRGKDLQFWAGNYGIKMTGASIKVIV